MKIVSAILFALLCLDTARAASTTSGRIRRNTDKEKPKFDPELDLKLELDDNCPVFTRNPDGDEDLSQRMIDATLPCGTYAGRGCNYPVIKPNVDYRDNDGDIDGETYIVQFDIGVHPNIRNKVMNDNHKSSDRRDCIGCNKESETCLELIVRGDSDATGGCAGLCGSGCGGAWYAKDCFKHDVCATYKALLQRKSHDFTDGDGFCYDVDCGDEAAQTVMNCYIDNWGPIDTPITCEQFRFSNKNAYGFWIYSTNAFSTGPCYNFVNWGNGQGLPDKNRISNPYEYLAHLESQGVDVSGAYDFDVDTKDATQSAE